MKFLVQSVTPISPTKQKTFIVENTEAKTNGSVISDGVKDRDRRTISIGQANLISTLSLLVVTSGIIFAITAFQYMNSVNIMRNNTEKIISTNEKQNIQMRDMAINESQGALEGMVQVLLSQSSTLISSWIQLSIFQSVENNNRHTRDYILTSKLQLDNPVHVLEVVKYNYIALKSQPLTFASLVVGPRKGGNRDAVSYIPGRMVIFVRDALMTLCPYSDTGEVIFEECCKGQFVGLCNLSIKLLNYRENISAAYEEYFYNPTIDGNWREIWISSDILNSQFATPIWKDGILYAAIVSQINLELISNYLRVRVDETFPGMVAYAVEATGLLASSSHGNITYKVRDPTNLFDSKAIVRIPAVNSSHPVVANSAKLIVKIGYSNCVSKNMINADLGSIGFYYMRVSILQHYNLQLYLVVLLPTNEVLKSIVKVKQGMSAKLDEVNQESVEIKNDSLKKVDSEVTKSFLILVVLVVVLLVLSASLAIYINRVISDPINTLSKRLELASQMILSENDVAINTRFTELRRLAKADSMVKSALNSFQLYVPPQVVLQIVKKAKEARLYLKKTQATILFMDMVGFTSLCEQLDPLDVHSILADFMEAMSNTLIDSHATIDKYIGDCIMAFWNAPQPVPNHANVACTALMNCSDILLDLHKMWDEEKYPKVTFRAGLHTGEVLVGNVGSSKRLNYTVLGDVVNTASRLESLNKQFNTACLCSKAVVNQANALSKQFLTRYLGKIKLYGKHSTLEVHELVVPFNHPNAMKHEPHILKYSLALELAIKGQHDEALKCLSGQVGKLEDELRNRIQYARTHNIDVELVSQTSK